MYSLCSGGGAQPIIEPKSSGRTFENCMIFESTPTLTFWPKCSAIWVGVLSSEYGNSNGTKGTLVIANNSNNSNGTRGTLIIAIIAMALGEH